MQKISLAGFKDPKRRPRYIIWTATAAFFLAGFILFALMVTSTNWFCADICHAVQVDSVMAWERSTHANVSCVSCHMSVNMNPAEFLLKKVEALPKAYKTLTGQYAQPLNADQSVALNDFDDYLCTQCHTANRKVTPRPGLIIDHEAHTENNVRCTHCHNRIAHIQDFELVAKDPTTGEVGWKLDDWMEKPGCFRCHSQEEGAAATGACAACHPADFDLVPADHKVENFVSEVHADLAMEEYARVDEAKARMERLEKADGGGTTIDMASTGPERAYAASSKENEWSDIPPANQINYCYTCHAQSFCSDCHGMEMPHPAGFLEEHGELDPATCLTCHAVAGETADEMLFCSACHHGPESNWEFDPAVDLDIQHAQTVVANGVDGCLERCHDMQFCLDCHNRVDPVPTSHLAADFLRKPAAEIGTHAEMYNAQPRACEVCHGGGMINDNEFCVDCHVLDVPHAQEFRQFHVKQGVEQRQACVNCHTFRELCSDCHHQGAIDGTPWVRVHDAVVAESGATGCLEKCHTERFCADCHVAQGIEATP